MEKALDHVAGYAVGNDVSARSVDYGYQRDTSSPAVGYFDWLAGKWPDGFAPYGPYLVTADEVPDPQDLGIELEVNGTLRQQGSTADMIFTVAELVAFASRLMTLEPTDIIMTGTPAGVGAAPGTYLAAGDEMTVRIAGLGASHAIAWSNPALRGSCETFPSATRSPDLRRPVHGPRRRGLFGSRPRTTTPAPATRALEGRRPRTPPSTPTCTRRRTPTGARWRRRTAPTSSS